MSTKREQCHTKNPNPVLSVAKDCTVLYSNEAGKLLLIEWGVAVGEQLPTYIAEVLQRVLSKKSPEKIEVNVGKKVYLTSFYHSPEDECVNIYGFDISYQEGLEDKLCESEEKYRNIVETANEGIIITDRDSIITYVNKKLADMLKYTPEEIIGRPIWSFTIENHNTIVEQSPEKRRQGISNSYELKLISKDGSLLWVKLNARPLFDKEGKYIGAMGMLTNITDIKKAEYNLKETFDNLENLVKERTKELEKAYNLVKENEQLLSEAQRIAHIGSWAWNIVDNREIWSDEIYRIFGLDRCEFELTHRAFLDFIHHEDIEYVNNVIIEALKGKPYDIDYRINIADGQVRVINSQGGVLFDGKNNPILMRGIIQDITERKKAEERIRNLANIVESSNDAIITKSLNGVITSWNKGAEEVYGYLQEEIIGKPISTLIPLRLDKEANELTQMIKRGEKVDHYETLRLKKDGTLINVSLALSPVFDIRGKLTAISIIARDITQRKNQEQEREMSMKFLQLMNACKGTRDLVHSVVSFFREFYGFEAVGIRLKEGFDYTYFEASGFPEKFILLENSLCTLDDAGKPLCDSSGYPIQECMCGNVINGRFDPSMPFFTKQGSFWTNCTTELLATTSEADRQARTRNRCNGEGYESVSLIPLHMGEERIGLIQLNDKRKGMFSLEMIKFFERLTDYFVVALTKTRTDEILRETYKKLQEQSKELELAYSSLKESEKRLAEAQRMAHVGNMEWNLVTGEIYWSEELYRIFRRSPQESGSTYDKFLNYVRPDDREYVILGAKKALSGEPVAGNYTIVLTNGEERKLHTIIEVIFDERNTPIRMKGTFQDITELTKAEEKLRESEEKYRNIVETANEGIVIINENFRASYVNQKMADIVGYSVEDCLSKQIWDFLSEDSIKIVKNNFNQRSLGTNENYEFKLKRKDGSLVCVFSSAKAIFDKDGKFVGSLSMLTDITQKKEAEQELANIEIARKKEIHHRIKNNLQVISSLLDLQADKFRNRDNIKDSEVLEAFRESQDRVISMALIHEELYRGGGFERLNFSPYVEELAGNIFQTYRLGKENIRLNLYIDNNVFFNIDVAVPLGMIINELVSNAFKYAFQGRNEGLIQIKLQREEIGSNFKSVNRNSISTVFALTISDNGVGIPSNLDIEALDSLGLQLVTSLVSQLDGKLEIKRSNGTEFITRFAISDKNNHVLSPLSQNAKYKTYT